MIIVACVTGALLAGYVLGRELGIRGFWRGLMDDKARGERALERLAQQHGAQVKIWQGPGG